MFHRHMAMYSNARSLNKSFPRQRRIVLNENNYKENCAVGIEIQCSHWMVMLTIEVVTVRLDVIRIEPQKAVRVILLVVVFTEEWIRR